MLLWRLFVSAIEDSCPFSDPGPQGAWATTLLPPSSNIRPWVRVRCLMRSAAVCCCDSLAGGRDGSAAPLSVTALLALALIAHVDGSFRLPPWLEQQVIETALSLQVEPAVLLCFVSSLPHTTNNTAQ